MAFLKIRATAYGGPAIQGVMQAEFQERRQWVAKPQFVEGLAFVNMLPGAAATPALDSASRPSRSCSR